MLSVCLAMRHLMPGFFFFNDTATTEIYTLSLHDALPISGLLMDAGDRFLQPQDAEMCEHVEGADDRIDRKSTHLNSSHLVISYAVFCLKKKNNFIVICNRAVGLALTSQLTTRARRRRPIA